MSRIFPVKISFSFLIRTWLAFRKVVWPHIPTTTLLTIIGVIFILFSIPIEVDAVSYDDDTSLDFIWTAASGNVDHYNIYVSTDEGEYVLVASSFENSYTITGSDGHTYKVKVEANDASGNVGPMSLESDLVYCDLTEPTINLQKTSNITDSNATIAWATNEASDSRVRYGTVTPPTIEVSDGAMVTNHSVTLIELTAGRTYYYEIESIDAAGNTATDNNGGAYYSFTTKTTTHVNIDISKEFFSRKWWRATATVTIRAEDASGSLIKGVRVEGHWSGVYEGNVSNTTKKDGRLVFRTGWIRKSGDVCFTVDRVMKDGQEYSISGETTDCINSVLSGGESFVLGQNTPNPSNPDTWIPFALDKDCKVTINIYNVAGKLLCMLDLGHLAAGVYIDKGKAAHWDGRDSLGQPVASGIYYYTLQAEEFLATRKMVILK